MGTPFDFGKVKQEIQQHEAGTTITLTDEQGVAYDPPVTVTVAGLRARKVAVVNNDIATRFFLEAKGLEDGSAAWDAMQQRVLRAGMLDKAIAATLAWNLTDNGSPMDCTPDRVREVYEACPHFVPQVLGAMRSPDAAFRGAVGTADESGGASGDAGAAERDEIDAGSPGDAGEAGESDSGAGVAGATRPRRSRVPAELVV